MATLAALRSQALKDLGDALGNRWTSTDIDAYLNEGQIEFCALTGINRSRSFMVVTANQGAYVLTTDVSSYAQKALRFTLPDGTRLKMIDEDRADFFLGGGWRKSPPDKVGTPTRAIVSKSVPGAFTIYPAPDATWKAANNGLDVSFTAQPVTLAGDANSPVIPAPFHPALSWYAVYKGYSRNNDALSRSEANNAFQEFQRYVQEGIEYAKRVLDDETITSPSVQGES